jgi:hypothetical protein
MFLDILKIIFKKLKIYYFYSSMYKSILNNKVTRNQIPHL